MTNVPSDIEIAQAANKIHINDVAAKLGLKTDDIIPYGHDKAKISYSDRELTVEGQNGKLSQSIHPDVELKIEENGNFTLTHLALNEFISFAYSPPDDVGTCQELGLADGETGSNNFVEFIPYPGDGTLYSGRHLSYRTFPNYKTA